MRVVLVGTAANRRVAKERLMQLTLPVTGETPAWLSTMAQVISSPERHQRPDVARDGKSL